MRLIHTADLHLGMMPDEGKPWSSRRGGELWECMRRLVAECVRRKADLLLIAGDLFHRPPRVEELKELDYLFSELSGTCVLLTAGNHDYQSAGGAYEAYRFKSPVVYFSGRKLTSRAFPALNTRVYGLSFDRRNIREELFEQARPSGGEGIHILLGHGGTKDSIPIDLRKLDRQGFHYVALGHIHKPGQAGDTVYYAGSPEPLDYTEKGEHGYYLAELSNEGSNVVRQVSFIPFAARRYEAIEIEMTPELTGQELISRVQVQIRERGEQNIFTVRFTGCRDRCVTICPDDFEGLGNIVRIWDESLPDYDFEELMLNNRDTAIGRFIRAIQHSGRPDQIADKALYYGMEAMRPDEKKASRR